MTKLLSVILLLFLIAPCSAQSLIIKRGKKDFTPTYNIGDKITFKRNGEKGYLTDQITGFYEDGFQFRGIKINLDEVERVKVVFSHGFFSPSNGKKVIIAGLGLFLIDQVNHTVVQGNEARISQNVTITAAALVAFGTFWMSLRHRNIKMGGKNRMHIIIPHNQDNLLDK